MAKRGLLIVDRLGGMPGKEREACRCAAAVTQKPCRLSSDPLLVCPSVVVVIDQHLIRLFTSSS